MAGKDDQGPKPLTQAEFARWLSPGEAARRVAKSTGDWNGAYRTLIRRADSGKIKMHAETTEWKQGSKGGSFVDYGPIPAELISIWEKSSHLGSFSFWQDGDAELETRGGHSMHSVPIRWRLFGIRFDPDGVAKITGGYPAEALGQAPPKPTPAITPETVPMSGTAKHAGGAPRKEFWDDLWLAMFEKAWVDNWQPQKAPEIQKAMLNWADERGYELSLGSVKEPAKKLLLLLKKE